MRAFKVDRAALAALRTEFEQEAVPILDENRHYYRGDEAVRLRMWLLRQMRSREGIATPDGSYAPELEPLADEARRRLGTGNPRADAMGVGFVLHRFAHAGAGELPKHTG